MHINRYKNLLKRVLVILLLVLIINGPVIAFARAGGASSGGGSSSGGSHSTSQSSSHINNKSGVSESVMNVVFIRIPFAIVIVAIIIGRVRLTKKKTKSILAIKELSKSDYNWNYEEIKKDIEEAFYKVQIAWMERDQDLAKEYLSDELYFKHKLQTDLMKARKEKNILQNTTLLGVTPMGIQDCQGTDRDNIWVQIEAKSIDYTINDETNEVIDGDNHKCIQYQEYWKFIRREERWVLDQIKQVKDVENLDFFVIEVENNINKYGAKNE